MMHSAATSQPLPVDALLERCQAADDLTTSLVNLTRAALKVRDLLEVPCEGGGVRLDKDLLAFFLKFQETLIALGGVRGEVGEAWHPGIVSRRRATF